MSLFFRKINLQSANRNEIQDTSASHHRLFLQLLRLLLRQDAWGALTRFKFSPKPQANPPAAFFLPKQDANR
jgi:hypothetical protein